jgi:hypothetical protein
LRGDEEGLLRPDERLACFDMLFYTSTGVKQFEFEERWSPVWNSVGTHFRFQEDLVEHAKVYIRRAFGIDEGGEVPPVSTLTNVTFWLTRLIRRAV